MPSVPKRSTTAGAVGASRALALRVLRRLTGLLQPVLAPLLLARVTREETGLLERRAGFGVERDERARDSEPDRSGLTADPTTAERRIDVVDLFGLRDAQRLLGDDLVRED